MVSSNKGFTQFVSKTPFYVTFDDHEIDDNWDQGMEGRYFNAVKVWKEQLADGNPKTYAGKTYYNFKYGDSAFFVLDGRSYRDESSTIGIDQKQDLFDWLKANNDSAWKFICSPLPFTINFDCSDCWEGYREERTEILKFIGRNYITDVIILSG